MTILPFVIPHDYIIGTFETNEEEEGEETEVHVDKPKNEVIKIPFVVDEEGRRKTISR